MVKKIENFTRIEHTISKHILQNKNVEIYLLTIEVQKNPEIFKQYNC